MARHNAMTEDFHQVSIGDTIGLFTDIRIDRSTVPDGAYFYEIRHDDESGWDPVQLGLGIMVNFYAPLLLRSLSHWMTVDMRTLMTEPLNF